jgi:UDP-N-acetylmuramoylalanine--D-glutamate ligase
VSLVTFFLRSLGHNAEPVGNFGHPPYDPQAAPTEWAVLEVSSYQAVDVRDAPGVVVVTSLGADHLDWHGSLEQYRRDKLQLTRAEGHHLTVIPDDPELLLHRDLLGGLLEIETGADEQLATALGLVGYHNARNVSLALRAVSLALHRPVAEVRDAALRHAAEFAPLPGRLTLVRRVGVHSFVDDGLATNPLAAVAALDAFQGEAVSLIVGGFDRGVDYQPLATAVREHDGVVHVITMSDAGERIGEQVRATSPHTVVHHAMSMEDAVRLATEELPDGGVVLLSPAAPSFGAYQNWLERSEHFTRVVLSRTA